MPENAAVQQNLVSCRNCSEGVLQEDFCADCGQCTYNGCCDSWYCSSCTRNYHGNEPCRSCGGCSNCCHCTECPNCHQMANGNRFCGDCDSCEGCCACDNDMNGVQFFRGTEPVFHTANKTEFKLNQSKRYIAVEIEVARARARGADITKAVKEWKGQIVQDGSLPGTGFEINTAPANGDLFIKETKEICAALTKQKSEATRECGLHVHVDARDFNFYDIRKLAYLYQKIESALFSVVAPSRKTNRYCHPCGDKFIKDLDQNTVPKDNENKLLENVYGQKVRKCDVERDKYNGARYSALNLHSWIHRGTVECRMHHGTVNYDKIVNWGLLWAAILDFAFNHNEKEIKTLKGDPFSILLQIAPTDNIRNYLIERKKVFENVSPSDNRGDL